jgi:hypothetical protein
MFAAAAFISSGKSPSVFCKADWTKFVFGNTLIAIGIFCTTVAEWGALAQRLWRGEPLSYGIEYDIADYIRDQRIENFSLFMTRNHLVYWLLGRYPLTRLATHPSSLSKPFIRRYLEPDSQTTEDALRSVFGRKPTFVVYWRPLWYLSPADIAFVEHELESTYTLVGQIGLAQVYRRGHVQHSHYSHFDDLMVKALGKDNWISHESWVWMWNRFRPLSIAEQSPLPPERRALGRHSGLDRSIPETEEWATPRISGNGSMRP